MAWFHRPKYTIIKKSENKEAAKIPEGMWVKCEKCDSIVLNRDLEENFNVCPKCRNHKRLGSRERARLLLDEGTFVQMFENILPADYLNFPQYKDKVEKAAKTTGLTDAVITGTAKIKGIDVAIGITDFAFMGGSLGSVMGERLTALAEVALQRRIPLIIVSASGGGARMQEGILSLMQMAKVSAALARLSDAGVPYISVLTDPTGGGVTASFAMLGDINMAEPGALIMFAGPRVIEQTIRQKLPEGFQRSEFLLEHGMIDMIVDRMEMRDKLAEVLSLLISEKRYKAG